MKEDIKDIISKVTDETAERISAEFPTGDKSERDRIYKEVERRIEGEYTTDGDEVKGVEAYRPRIYMKIASAAAALVIIAGMAGGAHFLHRKGIVNNGEVSPASDVSEVMVTTGEEPSTEAVTEPETVACITGYELLNKIINADYDAFDQINLKYRYTCTDGASWENGTVKRDKSTGNESLIKTWTHTAEYYKDLDPEVLAEYGGLDEIAKTVTGNEMFMYKDLFVCVYTDSSYNGSDQYEAMDRSNCGFDQPNVFSNLYPRFFIEEDLDGCEIQSIGETVYLGRECTTAKLFKNGQEGAAHPDGEPLPATEVPQCMDAYFDIIVDNETGFILNTKCTTDNFTEEYIVDELLFNEDAELPEDAEYIRDRISECVPNCSETAEYDLSVLDE